MVKNLRRLACKFNPDQSEHKSSQVNASACKNLPNGVASRLSFQFAPICVSVQPGLEIVIRTKGPQIRYRLLGS